MVEMSLEALGEQYAKEADNLDRMIKACGERRRFAVSGGNSAEAQRQEKLMELHGQQRADLLRLSAWLRHYYGNELDSMKGRETDARHQSRIA